MKRFFGGNQVGGAKIHQLDARTWEEFVARYIYIPHPLNLTADDYHAKPKSERDAIKDGPYFCSVSFKDGETHRCDANADKLELVTFDLDSPNGDALEVRYVSNLCEAPEQMIVEALAPYSCVAYHTANSKPGDPRLRIIVPVKACDVTHHKAIVAFLANKLGLPKNFTGARETKTLSQPMYRPAQFLQAEFTSLICSKLDGEELDYTDVPEEIVEEVKRTYSYQGDGAEDCGLAFLPIRDLKVEDLREPLFKIDPDIHRDHWCQIGMAMAHQFPDPDDAEEAFHLYHEWSSGGVEKYVSEEAVYGSWKSFKPYATQGNPITIRSLFHHAMNAGWDNIKIATSIKESIEEWLESCSDANELMETGCNRIAALPFPNKLVEESLINALRARIGVVTGKPLISVAAIKSQLSSVKFIKQKEAKTGSVPNWLSPIVFIGPENLFHNAATGVQYPPAAFDNYFGIRMMPADSDSEQARSGRPAVQPSAFALNQINIERVDGTLYSPLHGGEPYFTYRGRRYLNTYLLSSLPTVVEENSDEAGALFTKHFEHLIEEKEYRETVIDFLCHIVQKPGVKIRWVPVIQSGEGAGKGVLAKIMAAVLGEDNVKEVSPDVIQDKWTDWMTGSVLTVLNEVFIPGVARKAVTNHLKPLFADDKLSITGKYQPVRWEPNETNCLAFTNYFDSFHIDETARRYMMIESPLQARENIEKLVADKHFDRLDILKGKWAGALRHWMLNREIPDDFNVNGPAPVTSYLKIMMKESRNKMRIEIEDLIANEAFPLIGSEIIALKPLEDHTSAMARNNAPATHWLRDLGFQPYSEGELFRLGPIRTAIWVKRGYDEDFGLPEDVLTDIVSKMTL